MTAFVYRLPAVSGTVASRLLILVAGLTASIVTARALGPEGRGQYYAITTAAAIIAQFGNLGLSSSNTYLAARNPKVSWPLVINGLWICLIVAAAAAVVIGLTGRELALRLHVPRGFLWVVCLLAPATLAFTFGSSILAANERFMALNWWQILNAIVATGSLAACGLIGAGVAMFVLATALSAIVAVIGLTIHLARGRFSTLRFDSRLFRQGISYASRAYLALLFGFLLQRAAVTFLAAFRAPREIGFFSVAAQIYDVMAIVPTSIAMVLFPMLIRQRAGSWRTTRQALSITLAVMSVACIMAALLGRTLIPLVFGQAFAPSYQVMLWLLPGVVLVSITAVLSQFLVADGFPVALVATWAAGLAVCVFVGVPLTQSFGSIGAAAAQSIGIGVVTIGVALLTVRRVRTVVACEAVA